MMLHDHVDLAASPAAQAAMGRFMQRFDNWWQERGPHGFMRADMFLREPVGCDPAGWARFRFVSPAEYRWGLFRTPPRQRVIGFGDRAGQAVWQQAPAEHRHELLRHIVVQADAEPGSVEQSHALAATAPSLYDLRNLHQFLLEEARHLLALAHVLVEHFGAEGELQAEALVERQCGDTTQPRLLHAFNQPNEDWLSYFIWCLLADRDGKYQLAAVSEAAFDPLARTAGFMLMEEPFHLSIGVQGLERTIRRTLEVMRAHDSDEVFAHGAIPLATIQRYLNALSPAIFDLFGHDESARARDLYRAGLRCRPGESRLARVDEGRLLVDRRVGDDVVAVELGEIDVLNAGMRRAFVAEVTPILERWNRLIEEAGVTQRLSLPSERFERRIGPCAGLAFSPEGERVDGAIAAAHRSQWLPDAQERGRVRALMQGVFEPGRCAAWIAPPRLGIGGLAADAVYVRL